MTAEEYKAICKSFDKAEEEIKQLRQLVANIYLKSEMTDSDTARKETAREILDEQERVFKLQFWTENGYTDIVHNGAVTMALGVVKDFKEKYGVEENK